MVSVEGILRIQRVQESEHSPLKSSHRLRRQPLQPRLRVSHHDQATPYRPLPGIGDGFRAGGQREEVSQYRGASLQPAAADLIFELQRGTCRAVVFYKRG